MRLIGHGSAHIATTTGVCFRWLWIWLWVKILRGLVKFSVSLSTQNRSFRRHYSQPTSWLALKKLQYNKSKHYPEHKNTTTQNKQKKTKARFGRLIRPPAWKRNRPHSTALELSGSAHMRQVLMKTLGLGEFWAVRNITLNLSTMFVLSAIIWETS